MCSKARIASLEQRLATLISASSTKDAAQGLAIKEPAGDATDIAREQLTIASINTPGYPLIIAPFFKLAIEVANC